MANETTTTTVDELIPADIVPAYVQALNRPHSIARSICWEEKSRLKVAYRFPSWSSFSVPAGSKTEAADFSRVALSTAETSAVPAFVGMEIVLSDESMDGAAANSIGLSEEATLEAVAEMEKRRDQDILAAATSATATHSAVTTALTETILYAALAEMTALDAQAPNDFVVILGHTAAAAVRSALNLSAATVRVGDNAGKLPLQTGYIGFVGGAHVFESGNVADSSTGKCNVITPIGKRYSGLGLVTAREIEAEVNRGREGARSKTTAMVFSAAYAATITRQDKIVALLST